VVIGSLSPRWPRLCCDAEAVDAAFRVANDSARVSKTGVPEVTPEHDEAASILGDATRLSV
jgi:hypothetical protein